MRIIKTSALCYFLFQSVVSIAQYSSVDIRQASAKGPFPIYINAAYARSQTIRPLQHLSREYASTSSDIDPVLIFHGVDVNVGGVINEEKIKSLAVEIGYRYLARNNIGGQMHLYMKEEVMSVRAIYRFNIFYPITGQLQLGSAVYNATTLILYDPGSADQGRYVRQVPQLFSGLDARVRLGLFDPAGTSGGLGYYIEMRYFTSWVDRETTSLYNHLNLEKTGTDVWEYWSFAIGITVPIAIRLR